MAIASVGTLGTSISSTSASTFAVVTATNALAAGDFALFEITTAPQTGAADGVNNEHKSFSGGTGFWTKVGEFTNASGCTVSLWLFEATGTVATGTTLTLTLAGAVVDKTASGWKFTKGAGTSIALDAAPTTNPVTNLTDASSGFGSAAFSGLASVARLYFRALGKKANTTTALTVSTGFTAITAARSRNNTSAVTSYGEFRINTSTGETSNPTLAVSGDTAGIFASLREVTPSDPTTLTDNFDDNSKDATKWGTDTPLCRGGAESGTVSEVNARTEVTPVASTAGYGGRLSNSSTYFDMTGKRIYTKVSNITSLPSGQEVYIGFGWGGQKGYNAVVQLGTNVFVFQGNVDTFGNASGVFSDGMWLGLRHNAADDTMHVETAPAAENPPVTWTDQAGQARDQRAPLKAVLLGFGSGCFNLAVGTPLVVQFDGFNTATTSGTAYNDNLSESAAAGDTEANAETFAPTDAENATAADSASPAGSTFGVSDAEAATAAANVTATQTFVNADSEAATAADSVAGGLLLSGSLNETSAAADNAATTVTWRSAQAESAAAADSGASQASFASPLAESATALDASSVGLVLSGSIAESAAASDTVTSAQSFANALGESAVTADGASAGVLISASLNQTATAADSATTAMSFSAALAETAAASDAAASSATMGNAIGENAGASDQAASSQVFNEALGENAGASDSASAGGTTTFNEAVNESLAPAMSAVVGLSLSAAATENAAAVDQAAAADTANAGLSEQAAAADDATAADVAGESIGETASAGDSFDATAAEVFPPTRPSSRRAHIVRLDRSSLVDGGTRSASVAPRERNAAVSRGRRSSAVSRARRVA